MSDDEKTDWLSLTTHPAWLRLCEMARKEWVEGFPAKIKRAIDGAKTGDEIVRNVAQVEAANQAINALLSYPRERIQTLDGRVTKEAARHELSRRGVGL